MTTLNQRAENVEKMLKTKDLALESKESIIAELDEALKYWSDDSRSTYGGAIIADGEYVNMRDTWRYIEAKLKEKNT